MKLWQKLSLGAAFGVVLTMFGRHSARNVIPLTEGTSTVPLAVGSRAQVQGLLAEYGAYLRSQGVNTAWFSPEELTLLHRTGQYAIPPKHLWDEMARTILAVAQPLRELFGGPLNIYNGYRPAGYNADVGGAEKSLHMRNAALDLIPPKFSDRQRFAHLAAQYFKTYGSEYNLGMGIYHYPNMTGVHVDALVRSRPTTWAATQKWIKNS